MVRMASGCEVHALGCVAAPSREGGVWSKWKVPTASASDCSRYVGGCAARTVRAASHCIGERMGNLNT